MDEMITFCTAMLEAVADFLMTPPIFYLFGLICFCFIAKFIKILIEGRYT